MVGFDLPLARAAVLARQAVRTATQAWDFLMPVSLRRPGFVARLAPSRPAGPEPGFDAAASAVLLESDSQAVAAFVVENDRFEPVSAVIEISPFTDSDGREASIAVELSPASVELGPGERAIIHISAQLDELLDADRAYRAEITLPGLHGARVPVAARRLAPSAA